MNESMKRASAGVCGGFSARDCATSRLASRAARSTIPRVSKPYLSLTRPHYTLPPSLSGGTCNIRPRFSTWGAGWLGAAAPMQFWMTLTEDPVAKKAGSTKGIIWQRRSTFFGISKARHTYQFRRIVDDKGKQIAGTWAEYKGQVVAGKIPESFVPFLKEMDQGGEKNTKMKKVLEEVVEGVEISGENLDEAASTKSKEPAATVRFKKTASHSTKVGAQVGACPSGLRAWTGHPSSQKTCKYDGRATNGDKKGKPCADATQTPSGCHCCPEGCLPSWMGCDDK